MRKLTVSGDPISIESRKDDLLRCLRAAPGLVAAYLFGSYGTADQTPLSDVDLAFVFRHDAIPSASQELEFRAQVLGALREDDVSITVLNRAPSPFQFRVLETGRLIYLSDRAALADFIELVLDRNCDFATDYQEFLREYDSALAEQFDDA